MIETIGHQMAMQPSLLIMSQLCQKNQISVWVGSRAIHFKLEVVHPGLSTGVTRVFLHVSCMSK